MNSYGEYVWIDPIKKDIFELPFAGKIQRTDKERILIIDDDDKEIWINSKQILKAMHTTSFESVEDMIMLGDLQEYAILRNLSMRYKKKEIYTYIGSMLVAINPYEVLPIYNKNQIIIYKNKAFKKLPPPHIFAIGNNAYEEMISTKMNQCIVISGESGAGKTESTKLILQYLAAVSGKHSWIEQQILEANPILEAFGNAKTVRNDNSSRFGKYIDIFFNESGVIEGAKIEHYLLEKSRIVANSKGERNYHMFYAMLAGLSKEEKKRLELEDAAKYNYLIAGETIKCDGRNDASEFLGIKAAMKVLSFTEIEFNEIIRLLAAILHIGNLKYKPTVVQNIDAVEISDNANLTRISSLLGVAKTSLNNSLIQKTLFAHGERVVSPLSKEQAVEARDAFVKAIYGKLFVMVVDRINKTIFKDVKKKTSIGVLDIFGFENFECNSFEQLCINYANENLQQFFVKYIFKLEQEEYSKEGINWKNIEFVDNQNILDMIGLKPMNIMALIDEETKFPKGSDSTLVAKLHATHGVKSIYIKPKYDNSVVFGIQHFAGSVFYDPNGFLEKNRDSFNLDLKELVMQSTNKFLVDLLSLDNTLDTSKKSVTLSLQFRNSLEMLMRTLIVCQPSFVRCIKPNEVQKPNILDKSLCIRQLRYSGMMETAKIRKAGFSIRHFYKDFVNRYRFLVKGITDKIDIRAAAMKICAEVLSTMPNFALGITKIFLKEEHDILLEAKRSEVYLNSIAIIQRGFRRVIFKKFIRRHREAAIMIQKHWRARGYRRRFLAMRKGFHRLQAVIISRKMSYDFRRMKKFITGLQAQCRGYLTRKDLTSKISEKSYKMSQLVQMRIQDEHELKQAGNKMWKEEAEERFFIRLGNLNRELKINTEEAAKKKQYSINIEEDKKIVDDVFGFLQEPTTPKASKKPMRTATFKNDAGSNEDVQTSAPSNESAKHLIRDDLSAYSFQKFAATYFMSSVSHNFSKRPLKSSLLDLPLPGQLSAQALWITILRFMGDIGEAKYENETTGDIQGVPKKQNIMQKLTSTLSKGFINSKEYQEMLKYGEMEKKLINKTLRKKNKLPREVRNLIENSTDIEQYQEWLGARSGNLEKLHFIIGHGILRKELRDEIYCQICKQLSSNPNSISFRKGWILLSLCIGCFPPSEDFELYLREFIRNGPELYAPYCERRLDRTLQNGARKQPPSYMELRASKNKEPIMTTINFMNETSIELEIDSATTSEEICIEMAKTISLKDILGFSLFITISNKVMSLGCEREFIFDAISNCEQFAKEQGVLEKNIKWQLFIQKEMFIPWHNPSDDPIATELIFHQIMKGINFGDYTCTSQKDLAMIAALYYYAEFGGTYNQQKMLLKLPDYLPKSIYKPETACQWEKLIEAAFVRCRCKKENLPQIAAKEDIVYFAKITWTLKFSRFFEVLKVEEEIDSTENVLIFAMNWTGVYLIDNQEQVLVELSYPEIYNVSQHTDDENCEILTIQTVTKEILNFKSLDVPIIFKWLNYLLTQLKKKSIYAVALHRFSKTDTEDSEEKYLELKRGDLITMEQNGDSLMKSDSTWASGFIGELKGYFPIENVYVLPCIMPPERKILELFTKDTIKEKKQTKAQYNTIQRQKMSTLRNFAAEYFRPNIDLSNAYETINTLRKQKGNLWSYSREPIKAPLLMKLQTDSEMFDQAVQIFVFIMKYMGDLPQLKTLQLNTDEIFATALENDLLRDEVYCQIMKQLTENTLHQSEERAWDLMWLASGLMIPSQVLLKELHEFLKSRPHPVAKECQLRLQKTIKNGNRKFPPYIIEVESIRSRSIQIYHKIYFPDDTDEAFLVESSTRASDLIDRVIQSFKIKSNEGFSLFVKIADKVISVPDEYYIFDFIYELVEWTKSHLPSRSNEQQVQYHYQIFFLKKLWLNFSPGKDSVADSTFYFYQERPKYLNGYYKINKTDAIQIAALIYRSHFGNDHTKFQNQKGLINELVPDDLRGLLKIDDWKKQIISAYSRQAEFDEDECKLEFLKHLQKQATFGSTFFVVNQNTAINYPTTILIAINRHGFHILDPVKKDNLKSYDFSELNFWSSGNTFFQITFGNMMGGSKLLCETTQGYKLDDLLSSYIKYFND